MPDEHVAKIDNAAAVEIGILISAEKQRTKHYQVWKKRDITIAVEVGIADIADAVAVGVSLVRVCNEQTIVVEIAQTVVKVMAQESEGDLGSLDLIERVWARRFDATTDSWGAAELVSVSVRGVHAIKIGADSTNRVVLAWLQDTLPYDPAQTDGGTAQSVLYASHFDGAGWSPPAAIGHNDLTGLDTAEFELRLDVNSIGSAVAAWRQLRYPAGPDPVYQVNAVRYDSQSGLWSAPARVIASARS